MYLSKQYCAIRWRKYLVLYYKTQKGTIHVMGFTSKNAFSPIKVIKYSQALQIMVDSLNIMR